MAFSGEEIRNSVAGAWEIFKGNAQGMRFFDLSVGGFWRSFLLVLPLAIPYVLISKAQIQIVSETAADGGVPVLDFPLEILGLLLDWSAFPLVLALLTRPLGISRHYVGFIVVRNWCQLLAVLPAMAAALLYLAGLFSPDLFTFLSLAASGFAIYFHFRVARVALDASISFAIGIVLFDFLISVVLSLGMSHLVSFT